VSVQVSVGVTDTAAPAVSVQGSVAIGGIASVSVAIVSAKSRMHSGCVVVSGGVFSSDGLPRG
jgi:hypothetical protein